MRIFLFCCLLTLGGCGDSPLLNHTMLGDRPAVSLNSQTGLIFAKANIAFEVQWSAGCPTLMNECSFDINLANPVVAGSTIEAGLWMPDMGHPSSPIKAREIGPLSWQFTEVYFIMVGRWDLKLTLRSPDGSFDEVILAYHI